MAGRSPGARVAAVVLGAGLSSRWGADPPKQLARWQGEPLIRRAARVSVASAARPVVVVTGHRAEEVEAAIAGLPVVVTRNPEFASGQASSVRAGLAVIAEMPASERVDGCLFVPCDQPMLDPATLELLIASFSALAPDHRHRRAVVPVHRARRGSPVLFGRAFFSRLAGLRGDTGGRRLLTDTPDAMVEVELPAEDPLRDVDTLGDLEELARIAAPAAVTPDRRARGPKDDG